MNKYTLLTEARGSLNSGLSVVLVSVLKHKVDGQKLRISKYVLQMRGKVTQNKLAAEDISLDNLGRTRILNAQHVETKLAMYYMHTFPLW